MQFESVEVVYGQTESLFANCIMIIDKPLQVLLPTDEYCDQQEFSDAVSYCNANDFPMKVLNMIHLEQIQCSHFLITVVHLKVR